MKSALVTGGAGFIGSHLVDCLLAGGWKVTVIDNFDDFYDPAVKQVNVREHLENSNYVLAKKDIRDFGSLYRCLQGQYDVFVHLAARAGVRQSIEDPLLCQEVNVLGTQNMLELARRLQVKQFVFASSSSVYGSNSNFPWREDDRGLLPISPYAASKVSGELLGHVYSHLYGMRFIALRFFTVYGPRQRPDLAIHKFARLMLAGKKIPVYGGGKAWRDFTYIDDTVKGIRQAMDYTGSMYEAVNLGAGHSVELMQVIKLLESLLQVKARIKYHPSSLGDVPRTLADISKARKIFGYEPAVCFEEGLRRFCAWL